MRATGNLHPDLASEAGGIFQGMMGICGGSGFTPSPAFEPARDREHRGPEVALRSSSAGCLLPAISLFCNNWVGEELNPACNIVYQASKFLNMVI